MGMAFSNSKTILNANTAKEMNNAKILSFREIRLLCTIRVETTPQNHEIDKRL